MGKKSSRAPNITGAAEIEGKYSRETARDTTYADRPDQYNPFGNVQWTQEAVTDPATGEKVTKWVQKETMADSSKAIFDPTMRRLANNAELAEGMNERIRAEMGDAPDWAQFGDVKDFNYDPTQARQHAEDSAYKRQTNRLDPKFESDRQALEVNLRNRGLSSSDAAYQAELDAFGRSRNDAYEQARLGSTAEGRTEAEMMWGQNVQQNEIANALRDQKIQEYIAKRGFSLNEQNALSPTAEAQALVDTYSGGSA